MADKVTFRVLPIEQARKLKQRKRDMESRREAFARYIEKVRRKRDASCQQDNKD